MPIDQYISMETTRIDYKEMLETKKAKNWLKSVSAFANTDTGYLVFGVRDTDHAKVGLTDCQAVGEKITELIKERIQPRPDYDIQYENEDGKDFIILTVRKGISTPYYYAHEGTKIAFVRKGNQSVVAPPHELNELILNGRGLTYDALPSSFSLSDVSFTLLEATYNNTNKEDESFDKSRDLISFGLAKPDGVVTNAGALLCDQGILGHSRVFCTRWKGTIKGSVDIDAIDDKEYSGSLISLLDNAVTFVKNNSQKRWAVKGLLRDEEADYPEKAVREVVVNALIHRDYQILGSEIHIDMYDDRLEVYSPGGMVNGWRIQDLNLLHVPSIRRNPVISDMFGRMHFMDRKGSGIQRIMSAYAASKRQPKFYSEASAFFVELPNMTYDSVKTPDSDKTNDIAAARQEADGASVIKERLQHVCHKKTIDSVLLFYNTERANHWGRAVLRERLGISDSAVSRILNILLERQIICRMRRGKYKFLW